MKKMLLSTCNMKHENAIENLITIFRKKKRTDVVKSLCLRRLILRLITVY